MTPPTLAAINDVLLALELNGTTVSSAVTARIQAKLDAANARVVKYLRWDPSTGTATTEKYYDVNEDAALELPAPGATVSAVRAYPGVSWSNTPWFFTPDVDYDVEHGRTVRLRPNPFTTPFEGATERRALQTYQRVEIDYDPTGVIDPDIVEGTALLAAIYYRAHKRSVSGVTMEQIGDYKYMQNAGQGDGSLPEAVKELLRPHRRSRPLVT